MRERERGKETALTGKRRHLSWVHRKQQGAPGRTDTPKMRASVCDRAVHCGDGSGRDDGPWPPYRTAAEGVVAGMPPLPGLLGCAYFLSLLPPHPFFLCLELGLLSVPEEELQVIGLV